MPSTTSPRPRSASAPDPYQLEFAMASIQNEKSVMRLVGGAALVCACAMAFAVSGSAQSNRSAPHVSDSNPRHDARGGRDIFRYDTFGDEQLWTNVLRMHEVLPGVDPATALAVGLKVDVDALPESVVAALRAGTVDLGDPAITAALLRLNAVVGVKGSFDEQDHLTSVGITCALCHSTVDNSLTRGIGKRLDGWANVDLNVGAIVALSPALGDATKAEFRTWGPGKYDPRHHAFDGASIIPLNSPSLPVVIPSIYGLKGVGFETYTADGPISYWNAYVGIGQMGGKGTFHDPRIGLFINQSPDLVTPKLPALLDYQLSLEAPKAAPDSFDHDAAARGRQLFRNEANCSSCHQGRTFTDVLSGPDPNVPFLHAPTEVGTEPGYAARTATRQYRTTPLRGLAHHPPYFHDGSAPDLPAVVEHYDRQFSLNLSAQQKADLVEYLKSL
jgi:mono/diheme cytochrome c family protein